MMATRQPRLPRASIAGAARAALRSRICSLASSSTPASRARERAMPRRALSDSVGDFSDATRSQLPAARAQRAIADYLDRETARIDALIAAKRRMVELLEERWQASCDEARGASVDDVGSAAPATARRRCVADGRSAVAERLAAADSANWKWTQLPCRQSSRVRHRSTERHGAPQSPRRLSATSCVHAGDCVVERGRWR